MTDGTQKAMLELAKRTAEFFGERIGELIKDEAHFIRWKYAHWVFDRANKILSKRDAKGLRTLQPGLAVRFLDASSLEDNDDIRELWARLLANAVDIDSGYELSKTHVAILAELNPLDAEVLGYFRTKGWLQFRNVAESTGNSVLDCNTIASDLKRPVDDVALALGNLWRLGCLLQEPTWESGIGPSTAANSSFRPSPLGRSLLDAVKIGDDQAPPALEPPPEP